MSFVAISVGTTALGAYQALSGAHKQNQALKGLEGLQTPTATPNRSIQDYYQEALNRYGVSPYQSRLYQMQKKNAEETTAAGLNALGSRGSALAGASRLSGLEDDTLLKAGANAEQQNNQRFNTLGTATGMKSNDDKYVFGINKMLPYQKQAQLYSLKAGAGGQELNAGLQGINSAVNNAGEVAVANKLYGTPKPPKVARTGLNRGNATPDYLY